MEYWEILTSKHEGLRCGTGYDKPLNDEGFLKWMIGTCGLFDGYPETRCMRQYENIDNYKLRWLPVRQKLEQAMQYRVHQEAGNASARATFMQLAAHPYYMQDEKYASHVAKDRDRYRVATNDFSRMRLWPQGRGNRDAWKSHPACHPLC